ncbi:MAG: EutN/CcmL family microcompartment protein [Verrucomicrobia bacterium]|nr:EutN/CcmL family microcompartment protein [Verrucomicrobiota bacterium]
MILARIDGVVVSTVCHPSMAGCRTVICQPLDERGAPEGAPVLALDAHGAGQHQRVLVSTDGAAVRAHVGDEHSPLRNSIIAILDETD